MKNFTLAALIALSIVQAKANDKEKPTNVSNQSKATTSVEPAAGQSVYRLVYQSGAAGTVKVLIYNERRELLFEDRIQNTNGFARPYNFVNLPSGKYSLEIIDANGKETKEITVGETDTVVASAPRVFVQATENPASYEMSVLGSSYEPLQVNIYDTLGNLIFTESIQEGSSFRKVYNLSKLNLTSCTFEVSNDQQLLQRVTF